MAKYIFVKDEIKPHLRDLGECEGKLTEFLKTLPLVNPYIELNNEALEKDGVFIVEDNYVLKDDDTIVIVNTVKGGVITAAFIGKLLLATVISYALNRLLAPDKPTIPKQAEQEQAQTEFTVNTSQNQARNGQPIPECFGTVVRTPEIISVPYRRYHDNKQYLYMLLCMGVGQNTINDIFIEDTNINEFRGGVFQHAIFKTESSHTGNDKIKDYWNENIPLEAFTPSTTTDGHVMDGQDYTITLEPNSVETAGYNITFKIVTEESTEDFLDFVFHQTLIKDNVEIRTISTSARTVLDSATTYEKVSFNYLEGEFDSVKLNYEIVGGGGNFVMTLEEYDVLEPSGTLDPYMRDVVITSKEIQDHNVTKDDPFNAVRVNPIDTLTDYLEYDIQFPSGLFEQNNDGSLGNRTVTFRLIYTDSQDVTTNNDIVITDNTRDPIRRTYGYSVSPDTYMTRVERITDDNTDTKIQDTLYLDSMKAYLINNDVTGNGFIDYGDMTILAVKIKATQGISDKGQFKVKVKATRDDLANLDDIMKYIWTSDNGGRQPLNGIDLPQMKEPYNDVISQRTTVYQALQSVGTSRRYNVFPSFNTITARQDVLQPARTMMFSEANIVKDSLKITMSAKDETDYDGVRAIYRNSESFENEFSIYPLDASFPEDISLSGITDGDYAQEQAKFLYKQDIFRNVKYEFETELDGYVPLLFDRVGLSHPVLSTSQSGFLLGYTNNSVQLNETIKEDIVNPKILFRDRLGKPSVLFDVLSITGRTLVLDVTSNPLPISDFYIGDEEQRTIYQIGEGSNFIDDILITEIKPKRENTVTVVGYNYTDAVYS